MFDVARSMLLLWPPGGKECLWKGLMPKDSCLNIRGGAVGLDIRHQTLDILPARAPAGLAGWELRRPHSPDGAVSTVGVRFFGRVIAHRPSAV